MKRKIITIAVVSVACLAVGLLVRRDRAVEPAPSGTDFNVLLISVDTLRADHLGCYGHASIHTPNIDRLAEEGATFLQCISAAPITLPSHASMMTGTYPFVHGVRDNLTFRLHDKNTTLAEVLKRSGYATAAVVGAAVMNRESNISQGFDVYHDMHDAPPKRPAVASGDRTSGHRAQRIGGEVADVAIDWLRSNSAGKFFLFVHFFDPHKPYDPPPPFADKYSHPYLGEVAYADAQVGRILATVRELGIDGRTLVVLTGDHGEGLNDHGEATHANFLYDSTLRVPLIFRSPGRIPPGVRVATQVRTIDLAPTMLSFVALEPDAAMHGANLLDSMVRPSIDLGLSALSETMSPRFNFGLSHLLSLRENGWKYIHAPRPELYDLANDPSESINVAEQHPRRANDLRSKLRTLLETTRAVVSGAEVQVSLSARNREALQSLGYVGGSADAELVSSDALALFDLSGEDPKDHKAEIRLTDDALHFMEARDLARAEKTLRELIDVSGDRREKFSWPHNSLGLALAAQHKYIEAVGCFEKSLAIDPNDGRTLTNLGNAYLALGRADDAIARFETALHVGPALRQTHIGIAKALRLRGRTEEAADHERKAAAMRR